MSRINLDTTAAIWRSALPRGCSKLVLQAFAHHINSDETNERYGLAWPSAQRVALMCGMSLTTVRGHIRALRKAGLLVPRWRTFGTTLYRINVDALEHLVFPADRVELDENGNPTNSVAKSVKTDAKVQKTDTGQPKTRYLKLSSNLSLKPKDSQTAAAPASPAPPYPLFEDVKPETLADFAACRKDKFGRGAKGKVTADLISQIAAEAELAGMTLQAALEHCCHPERRWASFKAEWLKPKAPASAPPAPAAVFVPAPAPTAEDIERARAAKETALAAYNAKMAAEAAAQPAAQPVAAVTTSQRPSEALPCLAPAPASKPAPAAAPVMPGGLNDICLPPDAPQLARDLVAQFKVGQKLTAFKRDYLAGYLNIPAKTLRASPSLSH